MGKLDKIAARPLGMRQDLAYREFSRLNTQGSAPLWEFAPYLAIATLVALVNAPASGRDAYGVLIWLGRPLVALPLALPLALCFVWGISAMIDWVSQKGGVKYIAAMIWTVIVWGISAVLVMLPFWVERIPLLERLDGIAFARTGQPLSYAVLAYGLYRSIRVGLAQSYTNGLFERVQADPALVVSQLTRLDTRADWSVRWLPELIKLLGRVVKLLGVTLWRITKPVGRFVRHAATRGNDPDPAGSNNHELLGTVMDDEGDSMVVDDGDDLPVSMRGPAFESTPEPPARRKQHVVWEPNGSSRLVPAGAPAAVPAGAANTGPPEDPWG